MLEHHKENVKDAERAELFDADVGIAERHR